MKRVALSVWIGLLSLGLLAGGGAVCAQGSLGLMPVPPAYGVAERLRSEALSATASAIAFRKAGNTAEADFQHEIGHRRAFQASRKYQEVASSRAFGRSPYAAEALYHQALLQKSYLGGTSVAIQTLKNLKSTYTDVAFPDKQAGLDTLSELENAQDARNKTQWPGSYLYGFMDGLVRICGGKGFSYSYVIAIILISVLVKAAMTPLSNKQYASMKEQQKLQPLIKEIQAKYKNDKEAQGRKVMEEYKKHGVNPAAGCLPMLVQLPVLYLLYYMIRLYEFQFSHGAFLWIGSPLAHLFPAYLGLDLSQPDIPILLLYALSMYVQQKMMITPTLDEAQAEQQRTMAVLTPFMTTYFFLQYKLPSAFILYYLVFNILSTAQQAYYMKKRAADGPATGGGDGGSRRPDLPLPPAPRNGASKLATVTEDADETTGTRRLTSRSEVPVASGRNGAATRNGATPAAKGIIAPKAHPKKKRR